jgi:trigger factor
LQVTINTLSDIKQEADIQLSHEELQPHFEKAYEKYRTKVELKGFRKGKVPMPMIKKLYGEAIEHDSLDTITNDVYHRAMEEKNIRPVGVPTLVDMDFKRGEKLRFRITFEVKPAITLKKIKGITVEKPVHRVSDEEIESELHHLRRANAASAEVKKVTDPEHIVTGDVQEIDDSGSPLIGKKSSNLRFYLADTTLAPEITNALLQGEAGGSYRASFESQHGDHAHKTHVAITVNKIEKLTLPPLDEALVTKVTGDKVSSPDEFRRNLRSDLERYWEEQASSRVDDALADEVVRMHEFEVPEALVNGFLDMFIEDIKNRSRDKKLPRDFDEQKFRSERRAYAVWQAKWMLLKERIVEEERIAVADEDFERIAEADAARSGVDKNRLLTYYKNTGSVTDRLLSDKVMAFLKTNAHIKEKVVEEKSA